MLNQSTDSNPFFSSLALKIRCAMYPPPPGSAPGYQKAHHCTPRNTTKVITGKVHRFSEVKLREKSGKSASGSEAPFAARIEERRESMTSTPPMACTA